MGGIHAFPIKQLIIHCVCLCCACVRANSKLAIYSVVPINFHAED